MDRITLEPDKPILDFECSKNPYPEHKQAIFQWRFLAHASILATEPVVAQAQQLAAHGIAQYAALHVASAMAAQADLFVTTDDRLLKRCQKAVPELNAHRPGDALAIVENWFEN